MPPRPVLHLLCGKMAAGKSTLSRQLASTHNAVLICEDLWLSKLYPEQIHDLQDYLRCASQLKAALAPHIQDLLRRGLSVVLDFPGNVPSQRQWFRTLLEGTKADHILHFIDAPDELCKAQLGRRNRDLPEGSKAVSEAEFDHITSFFRPPAEEEGFNVRRHGPAQP